MPNKRRKQKKDDPENLNRFRDDKMHLSEPSDGGGKTYRFQHNKSEFALHGINKLPRKLKRTEERHMKKVRRLAYNQRKPVSIGICRITGLIVHDIILLRSASYVNSTIHKESIP